MITLTAAQNDVKVSASGDAGFICAVKPTPDGKNLMAEHNIGGNWSAATVCMTLQALCDGISGLEDGQELFLHGFNMFFTELQRKFDPEMGQLRVVMADAPEKNENNQ